MLHNVPLIFITRFLYSSNLKVQILSSYHGHGYYIITQNSHILSLAIADCRNTQHLKHC